MTSGTIQCTECGAGYYSSMVGATSPDVCTACPGGTFSSVKMGIDSTVCISCDPGFYSNNASSICLPCPIGYYNDKRMEQQCYPCRAGFFSSISGSSTCMPCPAGHYNSLVGQSTCLPCPIKTYTDKNASITCDVCPPNAQCSIGTSRPMKLAAPSSITTDPYFRNEETSKVKTTNDSNIVRLIFIIVGLVMLCTCSVVGVIFIALATRHKLSANSQKFVANFDLFKVRHYSKLNQPIVKRGTYFGILCSVLFVVLGITILSLLLVDLLRNNVVDRKSIIPEQTLDANMTRSINGTYTIIILLHNFNHLDCVPQTELLTGIVPKPKLEYNLSNFTCKMVMECKNCVLDGSQQSLDLIWDSIYASASQIEVFIYLPHYIPNERFYIYESLVPESTDSIFKGKITPTHVALSLTRAYRTVLVEDNFLNSFLSRRPPGETTIGYVAAKFPSRIGSTVDSSNFFSQSGLRILITFNSDPNVFRIEQESLSSILEWLSKLFALLSATFTLISVGMRFLEKLKAMAEDRLKKNNNNMSQTELKPIPIVE